MSEHVSTSKQETRQVVLRLSTIGEVAEDERETITRRLRRELLDLDVDSVTSLPSADLPPNAKADPFTVGALLLSLTASGGIITTLIAAINDWLGRHQDVSHISVTIEGDTLEIDRATASQRREIMQAYIDRHSR
jgi:hypothetical protein